MPRGYYTKAPPCTHTEQWADAAMAPAYANLYSGAGAGTHCSGSEVKLPYGAPLNGHPQSAKVAGLVPAMRVGIAGESQTASHQRSLPVSYWPKPTAPCALALGSWR